MNPKRNIYLKKKTLAEARRVLFETFPGFGTMAVEHISPEEAVGRVTAKPLFARVSAPGFHAAAMDGIAVPAAVTFGAGETRPKALTIGTDAFWVNTGHVLPRGTDAVIMVENLNPVDEHTVEIEAPAFPWQNIRKMGEDIVATELLFPRNHRITPYCVGALIAGGIFSVPVRKKPVVVVIPTGSELVDWRHAVLEEIRPGQVLESNSFVLSSLVREWGAEPVRQSALSDDVEVISRAVAEAVEAGADLVLTVGGSSAGTEDYTRAVIETQGEVLVHGVTIMPGKPVLIGRIKASPVIGMPGYPVSMIVAFEQFVGPLLCRMLGLPEPERQRVLVETTRKIPSKLGVEEFLRVKLGKVGDRIVATSLPRGAGSITTITSADGIIRIPNHLEGIKEHETVSAELLRPLSSIENTLVVVGSHDNTLDVLADYLRAGYDGAITLSSSHVGSMGGLMALRRGVCHLAGSHLLDTEDGSYNVSYVNRFLPGMAVRIVNLVFRDQGLIVGRGNPKGIREIEDLVRKDIRFINRQAGSGTRILLDYRLGRLGIDPGAIAGYETEEFTHMATAVAVLSGAADVGLGIYAAAKALNLDFIPVVTERYDLIIPAEYMDWGPMRVLLDTMNTAAFKERVEALGGYSTRDTGKVIL
ncbi:molybdopterin biosynthesis protein [Desulfococcus sp.]|uniref:molybdopterin biosynthesis protein n=1 Tax=Desulfococcus sp. TaxID=2025834 RepID=UPI0035946674